jgi:hypothetical protein
MPETRQRTAENTMSDLVIRDIAGTSTRWDNPERTDDDLRQHLFEIGYRMGLLRTPKDDAINKVELPKEAADLLLILAHVFRRVTGDDAQRLLDERFAKFCARGTSPPPKREGGRT